VGQRTQSTNTTIISRTALGASKNAAVWSPFEEMMSSTTRTFIALALPDTLTLRVSRLQNQLAGAVEGVRWEVAAPYHVTLAFLGDVAHSDLVTVCRVVQEEARNFAPMSLQLEGIGAFPDAARARVVWSGLSGPDLENLLVLQAAITRSVALAHYPTDQKPFHPHVTLGRAGQGQGRGRDRNANPPPDLSRLVNHYKTWHAGPFTVNEVVIFGSSLTREGPVYAPLGRAPFASAKSRKSAP
jgi:RNA 2',3'-cyclic 3'-phosphodiesterase